MKQNDGKIPEEKPEDNEEILREHLMDQNEAVAGKTSMSGSISV